METLPTKKGRPAKSPDLLKKNRALSLTDAEYLKLKHLAGAAGVSQYLVKRLRLAAK